MCFSFSPETSQRFPKSWPGMVLLVSPPFPSASQGNAALTSTALTSIHVTRASSSWCGRINAEGRASRGREYYNYSYFSFTHLKHICIKCLSYEAIEKQEILCFEVLIATPPSILFLGLFPRRPHLLLGPRDQLREF